MGHYCAVVGCTSEGGRSGKEVQLGFFRFPKKSKNRREKWVSALKRINQDKSKWIPNKNSRICSRHFVTGKPSRDDTHPDYVPTIFPTDHVKPLTMRDKERHDRLLARRARIQENLKSQKLEDKRARQNIETINDLLAQNKKLVVEKNSLLEIKRALVTRKFKLELGISRNFGRRCDLKEDQWNKKPGLKDVGCQTDSGLNDFIAGDCLNFSCLMEGNNSSCEVLSPGFSKHGPLCLVETVADDEYLKSKPEMKGQFESPFFGDDLVGEKTFKAVCGVSEKIFTIVLLSINTQLKVSPKFSVKRKLVLFFVKLKHNLSYLFLGKIFHISDRYASELFSQVLGVVFSVSDKFVYWIPQSAIKKSLPKSFESGFAKCTGIIDATEIKIEAPSDIRGSVLTYSSYKSAYTLKFLVCISPSGLFTFISKCYGGRVTDCQLTADSGFLELLRPGDLILADKGFPQVVEEAERRGAFCVMPPFCRGDFQLTEKQNREGYQCSALRIHVERAIQRMKTFRILQFCEQTLLPDIDKIIVSIGFICNLMNNLIKD